MKIQRMEFLIRKGSFSKSSEMTRILDEVKNTVSSVGWPERNDTFIIFPERKANSVVPIKESFLRYLIKNGWVLEQPIVIASRKRPGKIDAVKTFPDGKFFAVEWETGNISSSHRTLNRMAIGLIDGISSGGILVLPSRKMCQYLADCFGNYDEIESCFAFWQNLQVNEGVLAVIEIEHDAISMDVPPIIKVH